MEKRYRARELQKQLNYASWQNFENLILRARNLKNNGCANFEINQVTQKVNIGFSTRELKDFEICSKGKQILEKLASGNKLTGYHFCKNETMILSLLQKFCQNQGIEFKSQFILEEFRFDGCVGNSILIEIDEPHHLKSAQIKNDNKKNRTAEIKGYQIIRLTLEEDIVDLINKIPFTKIKMV